MEVEGVSFEVKEMQVDVEGAEMKEETQGVQVEVKGMEVGVEGV